MWGVVLETVFSILLFVAESHVTSIANTNAATAIERAANLEKEAAALRKRAAEIEREYAWRTISRKQKEILSRDLSGRDFPLIIEYTIDDPEAFEYANQIYRVFKKTTLKVTPYDTNPIPRPRGIVVEGPNGPDEDALIKALTDANLPPRIINNAEIIGAENPKAIRLSIGGRFPPSLKP